MYFSSWLWRPVSCVCSPNPFWAAHGVPVEHLDFSTMVHVGMPRVQCWFAPRSPIIIARFNAEPGIQGRHQCNLLRKKLNDLCIVASSWSAAYVKHGVASLWRVCKCEGFHVPRKHGTLCAVQGIEICGRYSIDGAGA